MRKLSLGTRISIAISVISLVIAALFHFEVIPKDYFAERNKNLTPVELFAQRVKEQSEVREYVRLGTDLTESELEQQVMELTLQGLDLRMSDAQLVWPHTCLDLIYRDHSSVGRLIGNVSRVPRNVDILVRDLSLICVDGVEVGHFIVEPEVDGLAMIGGPSISRLNGVILSSVAPFVWSENVSFEFRRRRGDWAEFRIRVER